MTDTARVILWGSDIGAVTWLPERGIGVFQYTPEFSRSGIAVAPLMMPPDRCALRISVTLARHLQGIAGAVVRQPA